MLKKEPLRRPASQPGRLLLFALILVLLANQYAIGAIGTRMGLMRMSSMDAMLGIMPVNAAEIIMPVLNEDGKTTSLQTMPTITDALVSNAGDAVAYALGRMTGKGIPSYAPKGISFDDPIAALDAWGAYESFQLTPQMEERYRRMVSLFTCNFCCGSAMSVTINGRCGCAHAAAARGFFRYMLGAYGEKYSDEALFGEAYRWQAIWYPRGAVEDYLLATGRGDVLGHASHGGAGADRMHGRLR